MLTTITLTLNEERHLPDCLASLQWADEVVVFDSFSSDRTVELAEQAGARVIQHKFENYAWQRNAALDAVPETDWVLFVDADERVPPALAQEIGEVIRAGKTSEVSEDLGGLLPARAGEVVGGWIPRHNVIFGQLTLYAGWYPDHQLRLLKRGRVRYDPDRHVHELALVDGPTARLVQPMIHLNYATVREFVEKQHAYTDYDASILFRQGQRARPQNYLLQPLRQFWWRFVTLQGWRHGLHGLRLSLLMAAFQFVLYRRLKTLEKAG